MTSLIPKGKHKMISMSDVQDIYKLKILVQGFFFFLNPSGSKKVIRVFIFDDC